MCSENDKNGKLEKDTPDYQLATDLSKKVPFLNPDSNKVLVITNRFKITTGMVISALYNNFGKNIEKLIEANASMIKEKIEENARVVAQKKMLLMAAQDAGTFIDKSEIDKLIQSQYEEYGGKEKFIELLKKNDMNIDFVIKDYQESFLIQRFLEDTLSSQIHVGENEIKKVKQGNETATLRHILLKTRGKNELEREQIRKQMNEILQRAKKGEEFSELAKTYSQYPGASENGGLIKNFKRGDMLKPLSDVVFSIQLGEISDIVETELGYHIIMVLKREIDTRTNAEIIAEIRDQKQQEAIPKFIRQLKNEINYKKIEY